MLYLITLRTVIRQASIDITTALSLVVMPWRLRAASERMSSGVMIDMGVLSAWLLVSIPSAALLGSFPMPTLADYWRELFFNVACVLLLAAFPALLLMCVLRVMLPLHSRERLLIGLLLLWPVPLVLPALIWSSAYVIHSASFVTYDTTIPAWLEWPLWSFLSAWQWPFLVLIVAVGYVAWQVARLRRLGVLKPGRCVHCGYELHAIESDRCPECGTPIVPD